VSFLKALHRQLTDEQVKFMGELIANFHEKTKHDVQPKREFSEDKYARARVYKEQRCVKLTDLVIGRMYIAVEGDLTGVIVTFLGVKHDVLFTSGKRYVFLTENSQEACYAANSFVDYLPLRELDSIPLLGVTSGT